MADRRAKGGQPLGQPKAAGRKRQAVQDPEYWFPQAEFLAGRPRVRFNRTLAEFPAPTPQPTPCVLWQGPVDKYGYGVMSPPRRYPGASKRVRAHRWMWEMHNSPLIPGLVVRHMCDNRVCVNLDHLELGSQRDNVLDAVARGHHGSSPVMSPSQVAEVLERRAAGETWRSIHKDFSEFGLTTVRRAVLYRNRV